MFNCISRKKMMASWSQIRCHHFIFRFHFSSPFSAFHPCSVRSKTSGFLIENFFNNSLHHSGIRKESSCSETPCTSDLSVQGAFLPPHQYLHPFLRNMKVRLSNAASLTLPYFLTCSSCQRLNHCCRNEFRCISQPVSEKADRLANHPITPSFPTKIPRYLRHLFQNLCYRRHC